MSVQVIETSIVFSPHTKYLGHDRIVLGLSLILDYIREHEPEFVKAKDIAKRYGCNTQDVRTLLGWILRLLERGGFVEKYAKRTWRVTPRLRVVARICDLQCATDSSLCGVYGTSFCPLYVLGVINGERGQARGCD